MTFITHAVIFLSICFLCYWFVLPAKFRSIFLFVASLYFMSLFSIGFAVYFVFNALLVYFAGILISKEGRNRTLLLKLSLIWLVGTLSVFKYIHLLINSIFTLGSRFDLMPATTFSQIILPLGFSYIVFRLIHYIVEVYRKNLPKHTFWDFASFVFFFPTFISGPVDRFQRFQPQTEEKKNLDPSDINYGLFRIISGMIKKFVIADSLMPVIMSALTSPLESPRMIVLLSVYGLAVSIYMDFSGYTDMAIGVSRLFGFKIMENFNYPFFKKNIALFWRNWHMSVYNFIRDYFFLPVFGYRATQLKIYIGMFLTMLLFCLWHEGSLPFLLLGIYHGLGLVIWQGFQEIKGKNPRIRKMMDNSFMDVVSTFLTFNFVSFSTLLFYLNLSTIRNIFYRIISL